MGERTAFPWFIIEIPKQGPKIYQNADDGSAVCQLFDRHGNSFLNAEANAALIVKACNAHDGLVKALQDIRDGAFVGAGNMAIAEAWQPFANELQSIARAALAALEGK